MSYRDVHTIFGEPADHSARDLFTVYLASDVDPLLVIEDGPKSNVETSTVEWYVYVLPETQTKYVAAYATEADAHELFWVNQDSHRKHIIKFLSGEVQTMDGLVELDDEWQIRDVIGTYPLHGFLKSEGFIE
ncbi:hypothetical protein ACLI4R_10750 [Natrialbaceae archaeon A-chndr2]